MNDLNYVIMDLEWNQPLVPKKRFRGLNGEIIQIGAIKTDENLNEIDSFNVIIHPFYYMHINKDVSNLTGITQEMIDKSDVEFRDAILKFKNWIGENSLFITWSFSDIRMLENNLEMFEMDKSWLPENYDAQLMFDDQITQEGRDYALNYALYKFNEKPDSSHDALDDARSTLKVLRHLDLNEGLIEEFTYRYECEYDEE